MVVHAEGDTSWSNRWVIFWSMQALQQMQIILLNAVLVS